MEKQSDENLLENLKEYHKIKLQEAQEYYDTQLQELRKWKDFSESIQIYEGINELKKTIEKSNQEAILRYENSLKKLEVKKQEGLSEKLLSIKANFDKNMLDRALDFNKTLLDNYIANCKKILE